MDPQKLARCLQAAMVLAALLVGGYVCAWTGRCVTEPHVIEYREGAIALLTDLQLSGRNPYLLEDRPAVLSIYGIGYQWAVLPAALVFGGSLFVHRMVSCLFIAGSCALLVWALRRERTGWPLVITATALWWSELGQGMSIVARPDAPGLFLFLGSLIVPFCLGFTRAGLVLSAALSILGFYTKAYFVLGIPLMSLFLFLHHGKIRGVVFFAAAMLALACTVPLINQAYPCYFTETFFISRNAATRSWSHLRTVGGGYIVQHLPALLLLLVAGVAAGRTWMASGREKLKSRPAIFPLKAPLFSSPGNLPALTLTVTTIVMIFLLGLHQGNGILYYHQFISPFLFWLVFRFAARRTDGGKLVPILLAVQVGLAGRGLSPWPADTRSEWQRLDQLVSASTNAFLPPPLVWTARQQGKPVYDGGQTEYSIRAWQGNFSAMGPRYEKKVNDYWAGIISAQMRQDFDYVLVTPGLSPFVSYPMLNEHYVYTEGLRMPTIFDNLPVDVWRPKKRAP